MILYCRFHSHDNFVVFQFHITICYWCIDICSFQYSSAIFLLGLYIFNSSIAY